MNSYVISNVTIVTPDRCIDHANILISNGIIQKISQEPISCETVLDGHGAYAMAGFIDVHTHGCMGIDVNGATPKDFQTMASHYASWGVTGFLPTVLSDSVEATQKYLSNIADASQNLTTGSKIIGIHLEGPFLSPDYKGAMPECFLRQPDLALFDTFYSASQGMLKLMTCAPELTHMEELILHAAKKNVVISMGHTGASYEQAKKMIKVGVKSTTHTFNGMRLFHQHQPAVMGAALESNIYCEAICDGRHLHPGTVSMLLSIKGKERFIAVTDSMMAAGMPDGCYKLGINDIIVKNGDAQLADGSSRAGSTLTMIQALQNILKFTGCDLCCATRLLSLNPASLIGINNRKGSLAVGKDADLILLSSNLEVLLTISEGTFIYHKNI